VLEDVIAEDKYPPFIKFGAAHMLNLADEIVIHGYDVEAVRRPDTQERCDALLLQKVVDVIR